MKIRTEITMNGFEFMGKFYDHYIAEKDLARDVIEYHTTENGRWDEELSLIVLNGANVKNDNFRFVFEVFASEKGKINYNYPENLVAFALTMEYFGMKNVEILY